MQILRTMPLRVKKKFKSIIAHTQCGIAAFDAKPEISIPFKSNSIEWCIPFSDIIQSGLKAFGKTDTSIAHRVYNASPCNFYNAFLHTFIVKVSAFWDYIFQVRASRPDKPKSTWCFACNGFSHALNNLYSEHVNVLSLPHTQICMKVC